MWGSVHPELVWIIAIQVFLLILTSVMAKGAFAGRSTQVALISMKVDSVVAVHTLGLITRGMILNFVSLESIPLGNVFVELPKNQ